MHISSTQREQRHYGYTFFFSCLPVAVPEFSLGHLPCRLLEVGSAGSWSPVTCPEQENKRVDPVEELTLSIDGFSARAGLCSQAASCPGLCLGADEPGWERRMRTPTNQGGRGA